MKNKLKKLAGCALGLTNLVGTAAMAQVVYGSSSAPGPYLGASVGELSYYEQGLPSLNPTVGLLRIGQGFSPYFAIEARLGTTLNGGSGSYAYGQGYHIDAQAIYGAYAKGMLPLAPWFSAYGIVGFGGAQWHRNYPTFNSNDIAVSFGVGAEFITGGPASFDVEWARLTNGTNVAGGANYGYYADLLTFGVNWHL